MTGRRPGRSRASAARQYLLLVTEDGYGRCVAVGEIRRTNRGKLGVRISSVPLALALVVDDLDAELVLVTRHGKVQRLAVGSVPRRRRAHSDRQGRWVVPKGARLMRLDPGDAVASGSIAGVGKVHATAPEPSEADSDAVGPERRFLAAIRRRYGALAFSTAAVLAVPALARLAPARTERELGSWFAAHAMLDPFTITPRGGLWQITLAELDRAHEERNT